MKTNLIVRWSTSRPGSTLETYSFALNTWWPSGSELVDLAIERGERVFYAAPGDVFNAEDEARIAWLKTDNVNAKPPARPRRRAKGDTGAEFGVDSLPSPCPAAD